MHGSAEGKQKLMCFESKMYQEEEEEGMLNLDEDVFINYDDFTSISPKQEGGGGSDDYTSVVKELVDMNLLDADAGWDPAFLSCVGMDDMEFWKEDKDTDVEEKSVSGNDGVDQSGQDLPMVFFEWLKSNKELVSAEDLRSIKLKKSTIECAAKRLGGGKQGMHRLLKLILEWVQNHQLHKKKIKEEVNNNSSYQIQVPQTPNPNLYSVPQWPPHQQTYMISKSVPVYPPMMYGYVDQCFYNNGAIQSAPTWPPPNSSTHYIDFSSDQNISTSPCVVPPPETVYFMSSGTALPCQSYPNPNDQLVKPGPSSTKEARKNRKQKRVFSQGRSYMDQQVHDSEFAYDETNTTQLPNWELHWPSSPSDSASPSNVLGSEPPPLWIQDDQQNSQQFCTTRPGKNLKFLMQKVLKQTDVGSLGRIVLPKKEAEAFLPSLVGSRDGIIIPMEDAATTRIWNMRYRFWPNNKNRMYMLENAGQFLRSNGLREGDFIVIYADVKCRKYLIRGVKVRHSDATKQGKASHGYHPTNSTSSSAKGTV